jgi:crotonobetainyl-CoA:carnitine CoA-transferase CaiB-like acyl-CoA transferase
LLVSLGYDEDTLPHFDVRKRDRALPSVYRVDELATATTAAAHAAAAIASQDARVTVDSRQASLYFRSERYLRVNGEPVGEAWAPLSGDYRASDGRWIRLHCNFPHHADAVLSVLGVANDRTAVTDAVADWNAFELEEAVIAAGGAAAAERTNDEWRQHPHGSGVARYPLIAISRIGDAPPRIASLRDTGVLDLTRIIAGPVAGRALAGYGTDVLHVASSKLPTILATDIDTGFDKRSVDIDLETEGGRRQLRSLANDAEVFLQSYRHGALAGSGFGPEELAALCPGIVYVSLTAYGHGPWHGRRGFDSLVQMASGITRTAATIAGKDAPLPLPAQALDHATGWLAALGALAARHRQQREGGSWLVEVSLSRTSEFLKSLGTIDALNVHDPTLDDVRDLLVEDDTPYGSALHMRFPRYDT